MGFFLILISFFLHSFSLLGRESVCMSDLKNVVKDLSEKDCKAIEGLYLTEELPPSPTNKYADNEVAAQLGFNIFFDARFSSNSDVRCASCHMPELNFAENKPVSVAGIRKLNRNSPTLLNSARLHLQFWDGRADSVWSQTLIPTEHPDEMNFTRLEVAHNMQDYFISSYERVFGKLPDLKNTKRFPLKGKPGDASWEKMSKEDQELVNRVFANYGKSLEAYLRKAVAGKSDFDRYLEGQVNLLSLEQKKGLKNLVKLGCLDCHSGPMLTDEKFYRLEIPEKTKDHGLLSARSQYGKNQFKSSSLFSDSPQKGYSIVLGAGVKSEDGAFKTPSLRNLFKTHPYGHNGAFATLEEIIYFHASQGFLKKKKISSDEIREIVSFLHLLNGDYPKSPWNNWPDR